jgi:hypothetical protein
MAAKSHTSGAEAQMCIQHLTARQKTLEISTARSVNRKHPTSYIAASAAKNQPRRKQIVIPRACPRVSEGRPEGPCVVLAHPNYSITKFSAHSRFCGYESRSRLDFWFKLLLKAGLIIVAHGGED